MSRTRATIRDVARLAGFSTTAVSNALNNKNARIPESTRQKIREAARQLHYTPNALIRAMHSGRTHIIGLFMVFPPVTAGQFISQLLFGLQTEAAARGYDLLLHRRAEGEESPGDASRFLDGRIDGLFYWGTRQHEFIDGLVERNFPVAGLFSSIAKPGAGRVWVDETPGLRQALEHLARLGHREVHFPLYAFDSPAVALRRQALERLRPQSPLRITQMTEPEPHGGHVKWFDALFHSPQPPTALIAGGIRQGYQALAAAHRAGLRVPGDVSIICHEGPDMEGGFELATIVTPIADICREAIALLIDMIEGVRRPSLEVALATRFVAGRTVAPPRR